MYDTSLLASAIFVLALLGIAARVLYTRNRGIASRVEMAMQQILKSSVRSSDPRFAFEGRDAVVIRKDEDRDNGESTTYALTVYATNRHGEYFVFKSDGTTSSVSHLEHRLAKVILKNECIAPQPAG